MRKNFMLFFSLLMIVTGSVWGQTASIVITPTSVGGTSNFGSNSYGGSATNNRPERTWSQDGINFGAKVFTIGNTSPNAGALQGQASNGVLYNIDPLPGKIISIVITNWGTSSSVSSTLSVGTNLSGRLVSATSGDLTVETGSEITNLGAMSPGNWTAITGDNRYFAIKRGSSASYWSSIEITYETAATPCVAPTTQATALTFGATTSNSIDGSFTAASPTADKYLVVASTSATLSVDPVNGVTYSASDALGGGTVVSVSNATTFSATGLNPLTAYYFFVFALNDACVGGPLYNVVAPLTGSQTTIAAPVMKNYMLVQDASQLVSGTKYIIASSGDAGALYVVGNQNSGQYRSIVSASSTTTAYSPSIQVLPAVSNSETGSAFEFTLGGTTGAWSLADDANGGEYLVATSSSSNLVNVQTALSTWNITIDPTGAAAVVSNESVSNRNLRYNAGSTRFSCYSDGSSIIAPVYLYREYAPVPMKLSSFSVSKQASKSNLTWSTAKEINSKGFEIERSADSKNWNTIAFVSSQAKDGNSSQEINYTYTDQQTLVGDNFYRLKQVDFDGTFEYSSVRKVSFGTDVRSYSIYPNPAQNAIKIDGLSGVETIKVYNTLGALVKTINTTNATIDLADLAAGIYNIQIQNASQITNQKLVITK